LNGSAVDFFGEARDIFNAGWNIGSRIRTFKKITSRLSTQKMAKHRLRQILKVENQLFRSDSE
jgi:hypothetical protein